MADRIWRGRSFGLGLFARQCVSVVLTMAILAQPAWAAPTGPQLSSLPGASYTLYLNFGGFTFNSPWGGGTPGVVPAYGTDGDGTTFNGVELANIHELWSRVSESFAPFSVNVTTIDPAGTGLTDAQRQGYYDTTARMMHTVIGGNNSWYGAGTGGVSYVNVTPSAQSSGSGYHLNWAFEDHYVSLRDLAETITHENGHGLGLYHQGDFNGSTNVNAYSNGTGSGAGSFAPYMGSSGAAQRGLWANGWDFSTSGGFVPELVNEVAVLDSKPSMTISDPVNRHSTGNATAIKAISGTIDFTSARGIITTNPSIATPDPTNLAHYNSDYWSFTTSGGNVTLNAISGRSTINPGVADPGATLDAKLTLLESDGSTVVATTSFVAGELDATISTTLGSGTYYVRVSTTNGSDAGTGLIDSSFSTSRSFFDMGSYFLTGTIPGLANEALQYWDNTAGNGFGNASGTWSPSTTTSGRWNSNPAGSGAGTTNVAIATIDSVHFGTDAVGLGAGTVAVSGNVTANRITFGAASGAITLSGGTIALASMTPTITVNNASSTVTSVLTGNAGLRKEGAGTLVLSGASTYTGATDITAGTIALTGNASLAKMSTIATSASGATLDISGLTGSGISVGSLTGVSGSQIVLGGKDLNTDPATSTTYAGVISGTGGSLTKAGVNTLTLSGANSYTGATIVSGGSLALSGNGALSDSTAVNLTDSSSRLTISGITATGETVGSIAGVSGSTIVLGAKNLTAGGDGTSTTYEGVISGTNGSLTKAGAGTLTLTASNTYTGGTTVSGGTLALTGSGAISDSSAVNTSASGARFQISDITASGETVGSIAGVAGSQIVLGGKALTTSSSTSTSYDGVISGAGGSLTKGGTGTLTLGGNNSYTSGTTVTGGTLEVSFMADGEANGGVGASASSAANLLLSNGTTFRYSGSSDATTDRAFTINGTAAGHGATIESSGTGTLSFDTPATVIAYGTANQTRTLTLGGNNTGANAFGKVVANNGTGATSLVKSGTGTWILSGTNTYTGVTTVSGGVLGASVLADGGANSSVGASASSASNLLLGNGATFRYSGTSGVTTDRAFTINGTAAGHGATIESSGTGTLSFDTPATAIAFGNANQTRALTLGGNNTGANTFGKVVANNGSGATSVVKSGTGRWILDQANTYTGSTTVSGGTLELIGSGAIADSSAVTTSSSGARFDISGITAVGETVGSIAGVVGSEIVLGDRNLANTLNSSTTYAGVISGVGGSLTKTNTGTLTLSGNNSYTGATAVTGGTVEVSIMADGGANSGVGASANSAANLLLSNATTFRYTGAIDATTDRAFTINGTAAGHGITIESSGAGTLSFDTPATLLGFGANDQTRTLTLSGTNTGANTFGKVVANNGTGATSLVKSGPGRWILDQANTYTGSTTVSGGTLELLGAAALSDSAAINTSASGTRLDISGIAAPGETVGSIAGVVGSELILGAKNLTSTLNANTTHAGVISGVGGSLTKSTGGTLTLSGSNSYTGATTITGGTVSVSTLDIGGNNSGIGASTSDAANLVLNGGTLLYTGAAVTTDRLFSLQANGTVYSSGSGPVNFNNSGAMGFSGGIAAKTLTLRGTNTGNNTLAAAIGDNTGATSVTKTDAGTWVLSGANTYTGATTVSGGTLVLLGAAALSDSAAINTSASGARLDISGITASGETVGSIAGVVGSELILGAKNLTSTLNANTAHAGVISGVGGSLTKGTGGTLTLSGSNSYTGATTITGGTVSVSTLDIGGNNSNLGASTSDAANLVLNGGTLTYTGGAVTTDRLFSLQTSSSIYASGSGAVNFNNSGAMGFSGGTAAKTLTLRGTNTSSNTLAAAIGDNTGATSVTKADAGTWVLAGANTYTGLTTVSAGTLVLSGSNNSAGATTVNAATLQLNSGSNGGLASGDLTLGSATAVVQATGADRAISNLTILTNNPTFSGSQSLAINNTIRVSGGNRIFTNSIASGKSLAIDNIGRDGTNNRNLTIDGSGATHVTNAIVLGSGALTKNGTGVLAVNGTTSYTGATNVNGGSLVVGSSGSINSSTSITVAAGAQFAYNSSTPLTRAPTLNGSGGTPAILSGNGTISVALTLNSLDDVLSPGNSPGVQPYGTAQTWDSFTYAWEVNDWNSAVEGTNFDQIDITGSLNLGGSAYGLDLFSLTSLNDSGDLANFSEASRSWTILSTTTGIFGFLESEWVIDDGGFTAGSMPAGSWSLDLANGGNDLLLTYAPVPEPGAMALLAIGLAGLLVVRRRKDHRLSRGGKSA